MVGIPRPKERLDDYPHQFSGGMRQRVMIAMALALDPALIIADEPTTALDATVQAQVLELLVKLQRELGTSLILITHDLGVVADLADDVMVMYAGRPVELAERRTAYYEPHHPYTRGLLRSIPVAGRTGGRLPAIPGQPPSMLREPAGCAFAPRCTQAFDAVQRGPAAASDRLRRAPVGLLAAHRAADRAPTAGGRPADAPTAATAEPRRRPTHATPGAPEPAATLSAEPLMELTGVVKHFPVGGNAFIPSPGPPGRPRGRRRRPHGPQGGDARARRRDRVRQVDARALHGGAAAAHRRADQLRRP